MTAVIRIEGLTKRFGDVVALDAVSLDILENEFLALLGPSGCGKTTLLRAIAGFAQPDAGHIFIDNRSQDGTAPYERPVNMMFQSYALFPHMTAAGNVAFGLKQDGLRGVDLKDRVREALARVEMESHADRKPHQLSGGQKQRVALARCLAKRPRALLLDEPLAALDKHLRERTQLELMALRERLGITFVVVTHDQDEAMGMASRVAVMDAGRLLQVGAPRDLYDRPASRAVAEFFGHMNVWDGTVSAADTVVYDAGPLFCKTALPSVGTRVALGVRPEQIVLSLPGDAPFGCNHRTGEITDIVYGGTISTYFVACGDMRLRVVRQNGVGSAFERGMAVMAAWPQAAVQVLRS